ncbi:MAG: AAA family ATPase [Elusimicrobia bacterium]|nr:AAA family ATPase [Elusimicrobiota bacterium]
MIKDEKERTNIAGEFLRKNIITGEEYLSITSPGLVELVGIENQELHKKNTAARELVETWRGPTLKRIQVLQLNMTRVKSALFPSQWLQWDHITKEFQDGQITAHEFSKRLQIFAPEQWRTETFPNLERLSLLESPGKSSPQIQEKLSRFFSTLSKNDLTAMANPTADRNQLLESIANNLKSNPSADSPDVKNKIDQFLAYQRLDVEALGRELERAPKLIARRLIAGRPAGEKALLSRVLMLDEWLTLANRLLSLNMTPEDWEDFNRLSNTKKTIDAFQEIDELARANKIKTYPLPPAHPRDEDMSWNAAKAFYRLAKTRDVDMTINTLKEATKRQKTTVILIAGGFHSPGITRLLRGHQTYNTSIQPNFSVDLPDNPKISLRRMSRFQAPQTELKIMLERYTQPNESTPFQKWKFHFPSNLAVMAIRGVIWFFLAAAVEAAGFETIVTHLPYVALMTTVLADPILQRMLNPTPGTPAPSKRLRDNEKAFFDLFHNLVTSLENNQPTEAVALMNDVLSYSEERAYLLFHMLGSTTELKEKKLQSRLISAMPHSSQRILFNGISEVSYQTYLDHLRLICKFMDNLGELELFAKQEINLKEKNAINQAIPLLQQHIKSIRDIREILSGQEEFLRPFAKGKPDLPSLKAGNTPGAMDSFLFRKAVPVYNARIEAIENLNKVLEELVKFERYLQEFKIPPFYTINPIHMMLPKQLSYSPIAPFLKELERRNGPKERFKNELFDLTNPRSSYQGDNEDWVKTISLTERLAIVRDFSPQLIPRGRDTKFTETRTRKIESFAQRMGHGIEDLSMSAQSYLESPEGASWKPEDSSFLEMVNEVADMTLPTQGDPRAAVVVPSASNIRAFAEDFARTLRSQRPIKVVFVDMGALLMSANRQESLKSAIEGIISESKERGDVLLMVDLDGFQGENRDPLIHLMNTWQKENSDGGAPPLITLCTERTFNTQLQEDRTRQALTSNIVRSQNPKALARKGLGQLLDPILRRTRLRIPNQDVLDRLLSQLAKTDPFDIADRAARLISELGERIHGLKIRSHKGQSEITETEIISALESGTPDRLPLSLRVAAREPSMPEDSRNSAIAKLAELQDLLNRDPHNESIARLKRYLEKLISVPWNERAPSVIPSHLSSEEIDVHVRKLFEDLRGNIQKTHHGLSENVELAVKDILIKIVQSDLIRAKGGKPVRIKDIPTFVGPPGVGKTTLLQKLGDLTGRPVYLISMNLIPDATSFRGTSPTYLNSKEGRLAATLISGDPTNVRNPIIICDEVDKSAPEVQSILLELIGTDTFQDNYVLDVPIDECTFVFTANKLEPITSPLLDRMDVIAMPGYTLAEKTENAMNHTLPEALRNLHLHKLIRLKNPAEIMGFIAKHYAREEGMRNFIRKLDQVLVSAFIRFLETGSPTSINTEFVQSVLGDPVTFLQIPDSDLVGVATYPSLTGDLVDVHATNKSVAPPLATRPKFQKFVDLVNRVMETEGPNWVNVISNQFKPSSRATTIAGLQLDVPRVVPEDSAAQLSLAIAGLSKATGVPVRRETAFVGELDLRGDLREANEIRKRALTAYDAGARVMVLPHQNKDDMLFRTFPSVLALRGPVLEPPEANQGLWTLYLPKSYDGNSPGGEDLTVNFHIHTGTKEELIEIAESQLYTEGGGVRCLYLFARDVEDTFPFAFVQSDRPAFKLTFAPLRSELRAVEEEGQENKPIQIPLNKKITDDYHIPPWNIIVAGKEVDIRRRLLGIKNDDAVLLAKQIIENTNEHTIDENAAQLEALARYSLVQSRGGALIDLFLEMDPTTLTELAARMTPETVGALIHDKKADRFFKEIPRWEKSLKIIETALGTITSSGSIDDEAVKELRELTTHYELFPPLIDDPSSIISISPLRAIIDAILSGPAKERANNTNLLKSELRKILDLGRRGVKKYLNAGPYCADPVSLNLITNLMDQRYTEQSIYRRLMRTAKDDSPIPGEVWNAYLANESLQKELELENIKFISLPIESPTEEHLMDVVFNAPASRFVESMARNDFKTMTLTGCPNTLKNLWASYLLKRLWEEGLPSRMIKIDVLKLLTSPIYLDELIETKWERIGKIVETAGKAGNLTVWIDLDEIPQGTPPFFVSRIIQLLSQGSKSAPILFTGKEFTHQSLVDSAPAYAQSVVEQSVNAGNPIALWNLEISERKQNFGLKIDPSALAHLSQLVETEEIGLTLARKILDRTQTTSGTPCTAETINIIRTAIKTETDQSLQWATLWDKYESVSPQMSAGAKTAGH